MNQFIDHFPGLSATHFDELAEVFAATWDLVMEHDEPDFGDNNAIRGLRFHYWIRHECEQRQLDWPWLRLRFAGDQPHLLVDGYPVRFANGEPEGLRLRHRSMTLFEYGGLKDLVAGPERILRIVSQVDGGEVVVQLATFSVDGGTQPLESEVILRRPLRSVSRDKLREFVNLYPGTPTGPGAPAIRRKSAK